MKHQTPLLEPLIAYHQLPLPIDWTNVFHRRAPLIIEIGFGLGEVLMRLAQHHPETNFIGIEENGERIAKTLQSIERRKNLDNIRILDVDARVAFDMMFVPRQIAKVFSLFPCPWPKRGHTRHRLFSKNFLATINSRLEDNGHLQIVTDWKEYRDWIIQESTSSGFSLESKPTAARFDTKFERKWQKKGQKEFYELDFIKVDHIDVPVKHEVELKNYKIKSFDPKLFKCPKVTGETSIVFKDIVYDSSKKQAMVHLVVVEDHLSQHFWVDIVHRKDHWLIRRAEGQQVFQTSGLQKSLELVYEATSV